MDCKLEQTLTCVCSLRRICVRMPTRSSSTLWFSAADVSVYFDLYVFATAFASGGKGRRKVYS